MKVLEVVAGVLIVEGRVLACRRAQGRESAGMWEFPGGKVEQGEEPTIALARELAEELALEARIGAEVDRATTAVGDVAIDLRCFVASVVGRPPTASTDHDKLRWVTAAEASQLEWAAPDLSMVGKLPVLLA